MKKIFLLSALLIFSSCSRDSEIKPAQIRYGQDICTACAMIISEKRYSAQYLLADGSVKKFDDIGCMVEHIKQTKDERDRATAIFVRDYNTNNWINAKNAHFLKSDKIITPMGHGIIAFSKEEDLKKTQSETGGQELGELSNLNY